MTADQFAALSALMGLRTGPAREAARLVLVEGLTKAEAARRAGCAPQSADQAVKRCQRVIDLARRVVPHEHQPHTTGKATGGAA